MSRIHPAQGVPVALFLGGYDPSAGAGVLRDVAVASGLGVYPMAIPLAHTIQNGFECEEISPPSLDPMKQLKFLKPHLSGNWGVKLSMFHSCSLLHDLIPQISQSAPSAAIWDSILGPTCGPGLHSPATLKDAARALAGNHWVASPNIPEARFIADMPKEPLENVAKRILELGFQSAWIRGGHSDAETVQDLWCDNNGPQWLTSYSRLDGDPRGTGCTATSAWLAYRLNGMPPLNAAEAAIQYIRRAWGGLHRPGDAGRPAFPPGIC